MLVPHKFVSVFLEVGFEFFKSIAESVENSFHVAAFLHRNNAQVIFLVDPDQKVFVVVVPDTASVGPVAGLKICKIDKILYVIDLIFITCEI